MGPSLYEGADPAASPATPPLPMSKPRLRLTRQCALAFLQPLLDAVGLTDSDLEKRRPFCLTVRFHFNVIGTDAT